MATTATTTDHAFVSIFQSTRVRDDALFENFDNVDTLVLVNDNNGDDGKIVKSFQNFETLLETLSNTNTLPDNKRKCSKAHDTAIAPHDWYVQGTNYFLIMVKPFIESRHYNLVKDDLDFNRFFDTNVINYGNECKQANDYYYWPNVEVSYFGWRLYLCMRHNIDIGDRIPLIHNRRLGNVNLFEFNCKEFLNVEMSLVCNDQTLFVNGRTRFEKHHDDLFHITMADGSTGTCKISANLVYSSKNFFDYIRDDINLCKCTTDDKYKQMIRIDLQELRTFCKSNDKRFEYVAKDRVKIHKNLTASSVFSDLIKEHVSDSLQKITMAMVEFTKEQESSSSKMLGKYLLKSNMINFDYIIIVLWLTMRKDFEYGECDIRLFMDILCEQISFPDNNNDDEELLDGELYEKIKMMPRKRCEPYCKLAPDVFMRFCEHWTVFLTEDAATTLGYYFAIHCLINDKHGTWEYTPSNAMSCGLEPQQLCLGFFKKIQSAGACMIFDGKHYVAMKKDDELFKFTEKCPAITLPSVRFNKWKHLYFTEEGVFNLLINNYHSPCPFIMGNTLISPLTKKQESTYLPERVVQYMLDNGKNECEIFKTYHAAKICRDIITVKNNLAIISTFDNCKECRAAEQDRLNMMFREVWSYDERELVILGVYLNQRKMDDIVANFKCDQCKNKKLVNKRCECLQRFDVDVRAFKLALMFELFCYDVGLKEIVWSLLYKDHTYAQILADIIVKSPINVHVKEVFRCRLQVLRRLYDKFDRVDYVDTIIQEFTDPDKFVCRLLLDDNENGTDSAYASDAENDEKTMEIAATKMTNFFSCYCETKKVLKRWNVWWDKLIVARPEDNLNTWMVRFYMRVVMAKLKLDAYSSQFVKQIIMGYLYFRQFTNFNYANSLLLIHFGASLGIPSDYEKCCIYLNGKPGSGKSSFYELFDHFVVVHKHDADKYTLLKNNTDEMEANKLISQLYVINEMKECNDAFFKNTADSTKSNSVCRKYQGSQRYEANYKLMIINNKPLFVSDYDRAVRNRFAIVYTDHEFIDMQFSGSVYSHIKQKKYPMERSYTENLAKPTRLFLSHILMYKRNAKDGYVSYKNIVKNDSIHNYNLNCMDISNNPFKALLYVLNYKKNPHAERISKDKIDKTIELAAPVVETLVHDLLKRKKKDHLQHRVEALRVEFHKKFELNYRACDDTYFGMDLALEKKDFVERKPTFKC